MLFTSPQSIISSVHSATKVLPSLLKGNAILRPLVCTDKGLLASGLLDEPLKKMREMGVDPIVYDGATPDPTEEDVLRGVQFAKEHKVDGVVGFGGGSPMDVAKLISYLASPKNAAVQLQSCYGVNVMLPSETQFPSLNAPALSRLPLIQVPTTAGTGSEVTPISIITTPERKFGIVSHLLIPDYAILDGALTCGLPKRMTAFTGIDAMVHAIEAMTSKDRKNPLSNMMAKEALRLLSFNIREVVNDNPHNLKARGDMLLGSTLAGMAFANSPVGGVHALAYPLGGLFKVQHGLSCSLMLTAVMRYNILGKVNPRGSSIDQSSAGGGGGGGDGDNICSAEYAEMRDIVFPEMTLGLGGGGGMLSRSLEFCDEMDSLMLDLGLPNQISKACGATMGDCEAMAVDSMEQKRLLDNNPREIDLGTAKEIYESLI
jgi:alcohol dehydrogenase class IV